MKRAGSKNQGPGQRCGVLPLMQRLAKGDGEAAGRRRGERNGQLTPRA